MERRRHAYGKKQSYKMEGKLGLGSGLTSSVEVIRSYQPEVAQAVKVSLITFGNPYTDCRLTLQKIKI